MWLPILYERCNLRIDQSPVQGSRCSEMEVRFDDDDDLDRLETDPAFTGDRPPAVVKAFRKVMQFIRAAADERDFFAMRSLHFEKLKGARDHQRSVRLNDQWRLVFEFDGKGQTKVVVVKGIEDYH